MKKIKIFVGVNVVAKNSPLEIKRAVSIYCIISFFIVNAKN